VRSGRAIAGTLVILCLTGCGRSTDAAAPGDTSSTLRSPSPRSEPKPSPSEDGLRAFYPKSKQAEKGVDYPFKLSQCDLAGFVDFDGSFWLPLEDVKEAGLPPRDVMPFHYRGSMTLVNENRSVFRAGRGRLRLDRQDGPTYAYSRSCF
jgi:hypothetical protein